nr:probable protein phosphatase 2C 27 [Ipomoea batatas]
MAAGTDCSHPFIRLEGSYNKSSVSHAKDEFQEESDEWKQPSVKPPRHFSVEQHSISSETLLVSADLDFGVDIKEIECASEGKPSFLPVFRSGSCAEMGPKQYMEDEHIRIDNLAEYLGESASFGSPGAFYGVFDGHGGTDAASFVRNNILKFIIEDSCFPICLEKAMKNAFLKADYAFVDDSSVDTSSGTTALTALLCERKLVIANAGDCRAVLGKRGRAIELSKDHKPDSKSERHRIEKLGGAIYNGYLNGQLSVARALGDWHMKAPKGSACPLSAEPELQEIMLTDDDEFLIMGCDGLWDVMSSQCAVTMARKELMMHNDPGRCSRELVREALKRNTCDNLTVIVVCFSPDPPPQIETPQTRVRQSASTERSNLLKGVLESNS